MTTPTKVRTARVIRLATEYGSLEFEELQRFRYSLAKLAERVEEPAVLLDLADTEFVGAAFLGILADCQRRLSRRQRRLAVCNPSREIRRLLQRAKIDQIIDVHGCRADALRSLKWAEKPRGIVHLLYPQSTWVLDN